MLTVLLNDSGSNPLFDFFNIKISPYAVYLKVRELKFEKQMLFSGSPKTTNTEFTQSVIRLRIHKRSF
jgi:hypothetical protein